MNNFEKLTEQIISLLKNPANFEKPWVKVDDLARNAHTDRTYDVWGWNQIILSHFLFSRDYRFNRWLTFNQISNLGGKVKKGEKSVFIFFTDYFFMTEDKTKIDKKDVSTYREAGHDITAIPFLKCYPVFNVDQTEGLPESFFKPLKENKEVTAISIEGAENVLKAFEDHIVFKEISKAFYSPAKDKINAPLKGYFKDIEGYYLTLFHEIAHFTGHSNRLNREMGGKHEEKKYAFEELVAELTATFVGAHFGITNKIGNSAKYINSWLQALEDDTRFIFKAMKLAKESANYILTMACENTSIPVNEPVEETLIES